MAGKERILVLHGENDVSIAQAVEEIIGRFSSAGRDDLNFSRLDGENLTLDGLRAAVSAMPFMGGERLVVVYRPCGKFAAEGQREKFLDLLVHLPPSARLVLVEPDSLFGKQKYGKKDASHWLLKWVSAHDELAAAKYYGVHKDDLPRWVLDQGKRAGGAFKEAAAVRLAQLVGAEPSVLYLEIQKLLAYVNYARPVEVEDVETVTLGSANVDVFALVDALADRSPQRASRALSDLLEKEDAQQIWYMVIRQFRLLLVARDVIDSGGGVEAIAEAFGLIGERKPATFVAGKAHRQARGFSMRALEDIYRRLLAIDEGIKTGEMEVETALFSLTAALTIPTGG
ncbi:MAG: DNA polymerase III subunit delta [Chloroflexi bacterium]|nr:DNA polymerase III subunit delta [Chloroflexota bacterium]